jgi:hypothetical protein
MDIVQHRLENLASRGSNTLSSSNGCKLMWRSEVIFFLLILEENPMSIFVGDRCHPLAQIRKADGFEWGPQISIPRFL